MANVPGKTDLDLDELRKRLGDATLLEFVAIDGKVSVFVISNTRFSVVQNYIGEAEMNAEISQYLFHLKTGRFIDRLSETNRAAAAERLLTHGRRLYDLIIKPIERHIDTGRAVIAPAGRMHYLPFHALFDGDRYVAERFTVSYTPSAAMLVKTLQDSPSEPGTALIAGIADALMPKAEIEVEAVSSFFEEPTQIIGSELTIDNLREEVVGKAVLHLACHGNFRPDNPAFSSLDLFGEKMTANDVSTLSLQGCIVILSSCEGGLNEVARGEELIGLTGAFFAAGASTLVQSLWRVNDDAALELMLGFYEALTSGLSASAALQKSQLDLIGKGKHPYLWAPFIVSGRW